MNQFKSTKELVDKATQNMDYHYAEVQPNRLIRYWWNKKGIVVLITTEVELKGVNNSYYYFPIEEFTLQASREGISYDLDRLIKIVNLTTGLDQTNG